MVEKVIHGPMWQFECEICGYMGDCWDIEREAAEEMQDHKCVDRLPSWVREEMERLRASADQLANALRAVQHDRPSAHTDDVWAAINQALITHEEARRG